MSFTDMAIRWVDMGRSREVLNSALLDGNIDSNNAANARQRAADQTVSIKVRLDLAVARASDGLYLR